MTSPGVTWNFLCVPHAIALVGDGCTMWARGIEKSKVRNSGIEREASGKDSRNLSFKVSKSQNLDLRFHIEFQPLDVA
jgi:hypothetical protein